MSNDILDTLLDELPLTDIAPTPQAAPHVTPQAAPLHAVSEQDVRNAVQDTDLSCSSNSGEQQCADEADSLEWARDVMWIRRHLKVPKKEAQKWSGFRFALWEYAKENPKEYVGQMLPKATQIIDRANAKLAANNDTVEQEEKKSIAELQRILRQAIAESA